MATIISTKTSSVGGLSVTGDASGILQLASANGTTAVTIDASQNVGIGTSSPTAKLDVNGTVVFGTAIISGNGVSTADTSLELGSNRTGSGNCYVDLHSQASTDADFRIIKYSGANSDANIMLAGTGSIAFNTNGSNGNAGSATERMRIDSSGNVGIGTSSPSSYGRLAVMTPTATYGYFGIANSSGGGGGLQMAQYYGTTKISYIDSILSNGTPGSETAGLAFATASVGTVAERMRIDSSGNLLVGTTAVSTAPTTGFAFNPQTIGAYASIGHSSSAGSGSYFISFGYNGGVIGTITQNGTTAVLYNTGSDQRLKENIVDAPSSLNSINSIKVRSFDWKTDGTHVDYGYIAQELLEVAPEAVTVPEDEDQMMGVDFGKLTPRLVKAIQELKAIIDTQNARIEALEAKI